MEAILKALNQSESGQEGFIVFVFGFFLGLGALLIKVLEKIFTFFSPIVMEAVRAKFILWLQKMVLPALEQMVDNKIESKVKPSLDKIEKATHGSYEKTEGVLNHLIDTAEKLSKSVEAHEKSGK